LSACNIPARIVLAILLVLLPLHASGYTLMLSEQDLQSQVNAFFPFHSGTAAAQVTVSQPRIRLGGVANQIGIEVSISAQLAGINTISGRGLIDGRLEYRAQTGEFYLHEPRLRELRLMRVDPEFSALAHHLIDETTRGQLPVILVYRLSDDMIEQRVMKGVLRSVEVRGKSLVVELDAPF